MSLSEWLSISGFTGSEAPEWWLSKSGPVAQRRPEYSRVSNDNPYAESLFKTLKYRPNYQPKGFESIEAAREWVSLFVKWYNYEHHYSGINFLTPNQMRSGKGPEILQKRHQVYEEAKAAHPERWNGRATRNWSMPDKVYLNPETKVEITNISKEKEALAS